MNPVAALIFGATIIFSPFAAIIAYIITYDEYQHHMDPKSVKKQALQSAFFTLIVFICVGFLSGYFFTMYVNN
jgi:hypothetical protein